MPCTMLEEDYVAALASGVLAPGYGMHRNGDGYVTINGREYVNDTMRAFVRGRDANRAIASKAASEKEQAERERLAEIRNAKQEETEHARRPDASPDYATDAIGRTAGRGARRTAGGL
jgi:hypothetical protein